MARKKRIWYPGATYHVMSRGNRRSAIFKDETDYHVFTQCLEYVKKQYDFKIHSICLMTNHFHMSIETGSVEIWKIMHKLLLSYASNYNIKYDTTGHVSNYGKALKELKRIVSPQGIIIILFPVDSSYATVYEDASVVSREERIRCFGQYDHLRVFGRDCVSMLRSFGFTVEEIRGSDCDIRIKPVVGPGDYDLDILYVLRDGGAL